MQGDEDMEGKSAKEDGGEDIEEYDDYYELLGVGRDATKETIEVTARKLLAKYHPDSGDEDTVDIYKEINDAQEVLTDEEQRLLYNNLGHEEYTRRREESGLLSVSDEKLKELKRDYISSTSSSSPTISAGEDGVTAVGEGGTSGTNGAGETDQSGLSSVISYASPGLLKTELPVAEWVSKTYQRVWLLRLIFAVAIVGGISYLPSSSLGSVWQRVGLVNLPSPAAKVIMTVVVGMGVITFLSGVVARIRLPKPARADDSASAQEPTGSEDSPDVQKSNHNMNVTENAYDSSTNESHDIMPDHMKTDTESDSDGEEDGRRNYSLIVGKYSLISAVVLTYLGSLWGAYNPWVFVASLHRSGQGQLWVLESTESEMMELFNTLSVAFLLLITVIGVAFLAHGLSKTVWQTKFIKSVEVIPELWDVIIVALVAVFFGTLTYATSTPPVQFQVENDIIAKVILVDGEFEMMSLALVSVIALVVVAYVFRTFQYMATKVQSSFGRLIS